MKKRIVLLSLILMLVSPLFPALLTKDLQVIVPTGIPHHESNHTAIQQVYLSTPRITLRVIETPGGVLLVREHSKAWTLHSTLTGETTHERTKITVCCPSSGTGEGKSLNINVTLE